VCDLLRRGLNEDNYQVTAVTRPEQAVEAARERHPCLVILDLHMPGLSGLDVLKELRAASPRLPVVILTGTSTADERDEARRLGACEVLIKPINWSYLRNIAYLCSFLKEPTGHNRGGERP
jgi:DNA-binding response OmpR family regulator